MKLDTHNYAIVNRAHLDAIDAAAEREAKALEWLEQELGIARPLPLFQKRQQVPITRNCRYAMAASLRVNTKLAKATVPQLVAWEVAPKFEITTAQDRARRRVARIKRQLLLAKLNACPAVSVPFCEALKLAGIATRSLHRGIQRGVVKRLIVDGQIHVEVAGLRRFAASLKSRLSSIAA